MRWIVLILAVAMVVPVWAGEIIYVDDDADPNGDGVSWATAYRFLQDGLAVIQAGDEVRVAQGTYRPDCDQGNPQGSGYRNLSFELPNGSSDISLKGGYAGLGALDPNQRDLERFHTVLSGDLDGNDSPVLEASALKGDSLRTDNSRRLFGIEDYMDHNDIVLDGLEFYGAYGLGSVWIKNAMVTIRDCLFIENYTDATELGEAGAINAGWQNHTMGNPAVRVIGCRFERNASDDCSGAILGSKILIEDCEFVGNYSRDSGGALRLSSDSIVEGCRFVCNRSLRYGGAISSYRNIQINKCLFQENNASTGGAVFLSEDAYIRQCHFVGNSGFNGGGLSCGGDDNYLANCCFFGNQAEEYGGGVFAPNGQWEIVNCSSGGNRGFKGNFLAAGYSSSHNAIVGVTNCVVADDEWLCNEGSTVEINYSNIVNEPTIGNDPNQDIIWGLGNIDADPCFVDPGYWDINDTPDDLSDDFYVTGDCHLRSQGGRWDSSSESWVQDDVTSPCIDAGDPNSPIMHEPFPNGGYINIGVYGGTVEASMSYFDCTPCETIIAGDINGDCKVNYLDLAECLDGGIGLFAYSYGKLCSQGSGSGEESGAARITSSSTSRPRSSALQ